MSKKRSHTKSIDWNISDVLEEDYSAMRKRCWICGRSIKRNGGEFCSEACKKQAKVVAADVVESTDPKEGKK